MDARGVRRPKSIHDPRYRTLCEALKRIRSESGLTIRELAVELDEAHSFVWKAEAGERRIDAIEFIRWCVACQADAEHEFSQLAKRVRSPKRKS